MYLLAKYLKNPRNPKMTHIKGYMLNKENYTLDESVKFSRNLRNKDLIDHNVVINIFQQRIEKCNVEDMQNLEYDQMFAYFYQNYQTYFDRMFDAVGLKVQIGHEPVDAEVTEVTAEVAEVTAEVVQVPVHSVVESAD